MDFSKISLFTAMKKQMGWLTQRQKVLSENISNANTPRFKSKDLKPIEFRDMIGKNQFNLKMRATSAKHLTGLSGDSGDNKVAKERKPYETSPDGNSVVLEEQVLKVNKTQIDHRLTNDLYKKHLSLFRAAIGK
ncbi:MAG: flagellar basal body protein [Alphaproteobacteria bacterium]|nr:flagellar basal body protein [Rhodospirillales bacterium]MCW9046103.1 flagellar basal body protein [Alphaproteobacteria bacterium]